MRLIGTIGLVVAVFVILLVAEPLVWGPQPLSAPLPRTAH
jgi:hypothetical protein